MAIYQPSYYLSSKQHSLILTYFPLASWSFLICFSFLFFPFIFISRRPVALQTLELFSLSRFLLYLTLYCLNMNLKNFPNSYLSLFPRDISSQKWFKIFRCMKIWCYFHISNCLQASRSGYSRGTWIQEVKTWRLSFTLIFLFYFSRFLWMS